MTTNKLVFLLLILGISSSCEKWDELPFQQDAEGVVISMPYQWTTSLSADGELIAGFVNSPVSAYDGNVLFSAKGIGGLSLSFMMLSGSTGQVLWEYDDFFYQQKNFFSILNLHQHDNHLVFQEGRQFYHFDLGKGKVLQKEDRDYVVSRLRGIEDFYFISTGFELANDGLYEGSIIAGNLNTGDSYQLLTPPFNREHPSTTYNEIGVVGSATPFRDNNSSDIYITYDYSYNTSDAVNTYVGLHNYSKREHVYEKKPLALGINSYGSSIPVVYGDKVYYAPGRSIICLDLFTGEKIWSRSFDQGFTFSGFILAEDKILANNEDTYLYALDPETGLQLWKEKSSGTSSRVTYMNGVVYFTGGGDGRLHAVDIETGKHLWRIRSPDLKQNSGAWFKDVVRLIPASEHGKKGKVLVSSYLSAFCYEAAR